MTDRPTDHRNLDLWDFHLDVAFGRAGGRVIWQPRILCWFTDRRFANEPLPERYGGMSEPEIYRDLGCSNRIYDYNACFRTVESPDVVRTSKPLNGGRTLHAVATPAGEMTSVTRATPNSPHAIAEKRWIETPDEMRVAAWILDHSGWTWDGNAFERVRGHWGRLGAPTIYMPRVNVQNLYIDTMGVERAVLALMDGGTVVSDYFRALHENHLRMIEVINASPIELVNFGDNLHCATLSPSLYERYVLPAYIERCEMLHRAGKFVYSHWDGDTKALLRYARCSGLDGIEAITPKPQGDVTLEEVKEALGDEIFLLDGIPAVYFDETFGEEELAACVEELLRRFAPRLILGISDEISSTGDLERIRLVGRIVDDFNVGIRENAGSPATISSVSGGNMG